MKRISVEVSTIYNIIPLARAVKICWLHKLLFYKEVPVLPSSRSLRAQKTYEAVCDFVLF
jgi:hypothetical protein